MIIYRNFKGEEFKTKKEYDDAIEVKVMNVHSNYIVLTITVSNSCDDKFKDYDNLYIGISLSTNYALRENILLKDFKKEVMKILKKVCNNWLEYEMKDMNKMLNDFIKEK